VIALPPGTWRHALTGGRVDGGRVGLGGLFAEFPVALLTREDGR
jgi:maltooligosyltrehalose synthase